MRLRDLVIDLCVSTGNPVELIGLAEGFNPKEHPRDAEGKFARRSVGPVGNYNDLDPEHLERILKARKDAEEDAVHQARMGVHPGYMWSKDPEVKKAVRDAELAVRGSDLSDLKNKAEQGVRNDIDREFEDSRAVAAAIEAGHVKPIEDKKFQELKRFIVSNSKELAGDADELKKLGTAAIRELDVLDKLVYASDEEGDGEEDEDDSESAEAGDDALDSDDDEVEDSAEGSDEPEPEPMTSDDPEEDEPDFYEKEGLTSSSELGDLLARAGEATDSTIGTLAGPRGADTPEDEGVEGEPDTESAVKLNIPKTPEELQSAKTRQAKVVHAALQTVHDKQIGLVAKLKSKKKEYNKLYKSADREVPDEEDLVNNKIFDKMERDEVTGDFVNKEDEDAYDTANRAASVLAGEAGAEREEYELNYFDDHLEELEDVVKETAKALKQWGNYIAKSSS